MTMKPAASRAIGRLDRSARQYSFDITASVAGPTISMPALRRAAGPSPAVAVISGLLFLVISRFVFASGFLLDPHIACTSRSHFTVTVTVGGVTPLTRD